MPWPDSVLVRFQGGPSGGEELQLRAADCVESMLLVDPDTPWYLEQPDGKIAVVKGKRAPDLPWIAFAKQRYDKTDAIKDGRVSYQFVEAVMIDRCAKVLSGKDRRCGHEAIPGHSFCKTHNKKTV